MKLQSSILTLALLSSVQSTYNDGTGTQCPVETVTITVTPYQSIKTSIAVTTTAKPIETPYPTSDIANTYKSTTTVIQTDPPTETPCEEEPTQTEEPTPHPTYSQTGGATDPPTDVPTDVPTDDSYSIEETYTTAMGIPNNGVSQNGLFSLFFVTLIAALA